MNPKKNIKIIVPPVNLPPKKIQIKSDQLPPKFFENIFETEIKLKTDFSMSTLEKLINLYSIAIDFYSTRGDEKYEKFNQNLQILLNSPDVKKNIKMLTEKGKISVKKQERKNIINKELEKIDKNYKLNEIKEIIENFHLNNNFNNNDNNNINVIIEKNLNNQENNFLKRKEQKKKKISDGNFNLKKSTTFNENLFNNNNNNNFFNKNFSDDLKNENENFFEEFSNIFIEKIFNNFIKNLNLIYLNKSKELLKTKEKYNNLIKQNEIKINFLNKENEDYEESKEELENENFTLNAEQKIILNKIEENFNKNKEKLINDLKFILNNNKKWIFNLKEKYSKIFENNFYNKNKIQ